MRPGALGDTLLALPALRFLRRRHGTLTLAAHAGAARLLQQLDEVDHALAFDDPSLGWVLGHGRPPVDRPFVVAWGASLTGDIVAPSRKEGVHTARHLFESVHGQHFDGRPLRIEPCATGDTLIHVGSGSPSKNWSTERFAEVIENLGDVRLIVGEADHAAAARVEEILGRSLPRLETDLFELARRLAGARAYLGNDSGVSHLAGLCGTRTIVMFGPTSPTMWRPLGPNVTVRDFQAKPEDIASLLR